MIQRPTLTFQSGEGLLEAKQPRGDWMAALGEWYEPKTKF